MEKQIQLPSASSSSVREPTSHNQGMPSEMFSQLKFSYDNLETEKLKGCFHYCSLFPEDFSIEKIDLIRFWLGEGLLDNVGDPEIIQIEGYHVITRLQDSGLLEIGTQLGMKMDFKVKLPHVARDLAIWIQSHGNKQKRHLTLKPGSKLEISEWKKAERICLRGNKRIKELKEPIYCSTLTSLLLQYSEITEISDDFFNLMPMLRVLDMTGLKLKRELPTSLFSLSNLEYLNLPKYTQPISRGRLNRFPSMKVLGLSRSCSNLGSDEHGPGLDELEGLQGLMFLQITIASDPVLRRLMESEKLRSITTFLRVYCSDSTSLSFSAASSSSSSSLSLAVMSRLRTLQLSKCDELQCLRIGYTDVTLLSTLESLSLASLPKLWIEWEVPQQPFCSVNLKSVTVRECPQLKDLTWLTYAKNLEILMLCDLDELEEIISVHQQALEYTFSRLNLLELGHMKKLKRICDPMVIFSLMERIVVVQCPGLKKLPFNSSSRIPRTQIMIEGEKEWWESLEWEDETTKSELFKFKVVELQDS